MTLTEQWKKGELDRDRYYIKYRGNYVSDNWHGDCWEDCWSEYVEEVLAPVPSYEEWRELKEFADYSLHNRDELTRQINFWMDKHAQIEKENQQLKELLYSLKCCLISENIEPQIRVEKSLAKIEEFLTDGK